MGDQERLKWQMRLSRLKREEKAPSKGQENRNDFPAEYRDRLKQLREAAKKAGTA